MHVALPTIPRHTTLNPMSEESAKTRGFPTWVEPTPLMSFSRGMQLPSAPDRYKLGGHAPRVPNIKMEKQTANSVLMDAHHDGLVIPCGNSECLLE